MLLTVLHWAAFKCSSREIQRWMRCVTAFKDLLGLNQLSRRKLKGLRQWHHWVQSVTHRTIIRWSHRCIHPLSLDVLWGGCLGQVHWTSCGLWARQALKHVLTIWVMTSSSPPLGCLHSYVISAAFALLWAFPTVGHRAWCPSDRRNQGPGIVKKMHITQLETHS